MGQKSRQSEVCHCRECPPASLQIASGSTSPDPRPGLPRSECSYEADPPTLRTRNYEGKILVLSAHLSDEDNRAYEEFGVDMMMSKPFDFAEIQDAVAIMTKGASVAVAA